jgi:uncharacterized membrane protein YhaH (DUF805 family)
MNLVGGKSKSPISWALEPWNRVADFSGRSPRAEYWWYALTVAILGGVFGYIDAGLLHVRAYGDYGPLSLFFILVCVVPGLAVLVRRLHDTDRTGWWALTRIPSYLFLAAGTSPFQVGSRLRLLPPSDHYSRRSSLAHCGVSCAALPRQRGRHRAKSFWTRFLRSRCARGSLRLRLPPAAHLAS